MKKSPETTWSEHYRNNDNAKHLYPESFVLRLLLSKFPEPALENYDFTDQKVFDLSCGYGRNLSLLKSLDCDVYASEIDASIVDGLRQNILDVQFCVAKAHSIPHEDNYFDGVIACNSCYYLEPEIKFADNLAEIARVLKIRGWFIGSIIDRTHDILTNAELNLDSSAVVRTDKRDLRNGCCLQYTSSAEELRSWLEPHFADLKIGYFSDSFLNVNRNFYYFSCYRHV